MSLPPERALIRALTEHAESVRNESGFRDDCAVVPLGSQDLVASVDTFAASTHFPPGTPPRMAGRFATSAALSDLAAAGADPLGVLVAYGLPPELELGAAREVAAGVLSALSDHGGELLGGDTKPRPFLELTVTALGQCPPGRAMTRAGARPGDALVVTGRLGGAGAALARLEEGLAVEEATPLLDPTPRLRAGHHLRELGVRCAVDLSDGLAEGAVVVAEASGVRVVVEGETVPLHPWAEEARDGLEWSLTTGGDYELLVAVPGAVHEQALDACRRAGCEPAVVGRVEAGQGAVLEGKGGDRVLERGWEHGFGGDHGRPERQP